MKILKFFVFVLIGFVGFTTNFTVVSATTAVEYSKGPVLASVGIHDIEIDQKDNVLDISFNISNGEGVQTGVMYGVKLIKETDQGQFVVDEKVYDEKLTLGENVLIEKNITYVAPSSLDGEYSVLLVAKNESSFVFGMSFAGKINLVSSEKGIEILPESCSLFIDKAPFDRGYDLSRGVDVSKEESLILKCDISNKTDGDIVANPVFETHYRTVYGEIVPHSDVLNNPITLSQGENKDVLIYLPKALKPQSYDVKVSLEYENGNSNSIITHYVLQGASATIQNLSLDKDYYEKGETAKIFLSWFPSADSFPGSRIGEGSSISDVSMKAKITNKNGLNCTSPLIESLSMEHNTMKNEFNVPITKSCINPEVSLSLVDGKGNILDEKTFKVETTTKAEEPNLIFPIVLIIIALILILYFLGKKKNLSVSNTQINSFFLILVFAFSSLIIPLVKTSAYYALEIAVNGGGGGGGGGTTDPADTGTPPAGLNASINLDKTVYSPGETITVTSSVFYVACSNTTKDIEVTGYITNGSTYTSSTQTLYVGSVTGGASPTYYTSNFTAPSTAGTYVLKVKIDGYTPAYYSSGVTSSYYEDFVSFKYDLVEGMYDYYSSHPYIDAVIGIIYTADDLNDLYLINDFISEVTISGSDKSLSFSRNYDLQFTVIAPPTVTVWANGSTSPSAISSGGNVDVTWDSTNATSCNCTYLKDVNGIKKPFSCGNGTDKISPNIISGVTTQTTFTVICSN
ncbi:MAG: hypothetical protein PHT84_02500 [Candidatus Pacebacteria bacterium]|nr:hypothetical protein [Candidatus Paceibacterota bacterium]